MTSISTALPPPPPQKSIQSKLSEQVSAGEITSDDMDAMLSALDAIHDDMAPEATGSSEPPSKEEMQSKLESLLSEQVEEGTLTQDQADELSAMFESGEMGPPPPPPGEGPMGPPPSGDMSASSEDDESEDLVQKLLAQLSSSQTSGYSASGSTTSTSSSLLVDYTA
ncbi:hypothetical protein [Roseibium suaedae]|uniref:Uncharacterized protein n=1 Tax=Roseibium suaedae TaxID=735517 RepID=A0A1M7H0K5_9HYPH|nr:hypothetical protein [Roseibium suaedae]SHM22174.1 hypothetical protein SAMN05444272_2076 [Roseibium suaedae]